MRYTRRLTAILSAVLLVMLMTTAAFAADGSYNVWIEAVPTGEGETLSVPVITDGTATDGLAVITYDPAVLSVTGEDVSKSGAAMYSANVTEPGTLEISWVAGDDPQAGTLVTVEFTVLEKNADSGLRITGEVYSGGENETAGAVGTLGLEPGATATPEPTAAATSAPESAATATPGPTQVPKTGDDTPVELWGAVMLGCLAAAVLLVRHIKKAKRWIALVLCVMLSVSLLSEGVTVYAADGPQVSEPFYPEDAAEAAEEPSAETTVEPSAENDAQAPVELTDEQLQALLDSAEPMTVEEIDRDSLDVDLMDTPEGLDPLAEVMDEIKIDDEQIVRVIIMLDEQSVVEENPEAVPSAMALAQADALQAEQDDVIQVIESKVLNGAPLDVTYQYTWLLNGIAAQVPYGAIRRIEALDGVRKVILQPAYHVLSTEESGSADDGIMPLTNSDGPMIGREDTWDAGYTGRGMKIAIVDTGLDDDHPNFAPLPEDKLTANSTTPESIAAVLTRLHAYETYPGLTVDDLYRSTKVAYGFNYVDNSLQIDHSGDSQGDHGTHVAGIAAANKIEGSEVVGVAPDAQLYIMKVFGANGGAYLEDYLAAIEDAMLLGANVVNLSLGTSAGFTTDGEEVDRIFSRVGSTGTILSFAAGNSGVMGEGNLWGTNTNLTSNPDNAMVGSPATYQNVLSVASAENLNVHSYCFQVGDTFFAFSDGDNGINDPMTSLAGQTLGFAAVSNLGQTLEDFQAAGVEGKVALVSRGVSSFVDKCQLAEQAGAVACVIYNNVSGTINLDMSGCTATIPCVSITAKAGQSLLDALQADPDAAMTIYDERMTIPNEDAGQMSLYSSWGVTPDLHLEPDITAPGGNIYSTVDNGEYDVMSGTSMAAPNMSGISALVLQYVRTTFPGKSDAALHMFMNSILMSTSVPVVYDEGEGLYFSPRMQGSGVANAGHSITTQATLTVDGMDVPKVELMDDPERTGTYEYTFNVENFGSKALSYALSTVVQSEGVEEDEDGRKFMSQTPVALDAQVQTQAYYRSDDYDYNSDGRINTHDAYLLWLVAHGGREQTGSHRYDVLLNDGVVTESDVQAYLDELVGNQRRDSTDLDIDLNGAVEEAIDLADEILTVEAGRTATVKVTIQVTDAGKAYMDENFPNGIYVEGFTFLDALDEDGVDLSLPYMGFYGDWTVAPSLDSAFYWDDFGVNWAFSDEVTELPTGSQYINVLWTQLGNYDANEWMPGLNPYDPTEPFDMAHMSLSPNGDRFADYIDDVYVTLLRNARELSFTYTDDATGSVLFQEIIEHVTKSYYDFSYNTVIPYVYSWYSEPYKLTAEDGTTLPNNTKITLDIEATLDYDEHESANESAGWTTPITVDTEAPVLVGEPQFVRTDEGKNLLLLTVKDNVAVAGVSFLNVRQTAVKAQYLPEDPEVRDEDGGLTYTNLCYDVTGFGNEFALVLGDYACNERAYTLRTAGNDPVLDPSLLYGYRVFDDEYYNDTVYGWLSIDPDTAQSEVFNSEYYMDYAVTAAEYVGGYVIAVDAGRTLSYIRPGYWDERHAISSLDHSVSQLAFNPRTETLYAFSPTNSTLYTIDLDAGTMELVRYEYGLNGLVAMAWADDGSQEGVLYGINTAGYLRQIDTATGEWEEFTPAVDLSSGWIQGGPSEYDQSMTYSAADNCLYYAGYSKSGYGILYRIALGGTSITAQAIEIIAGSAEVVGLLMLDDRGYTVEAGQLRGLAVQSDSMTLHKGSRSAVSVMAQPWNAETGELVWTSGDESVASVEDGTVTAVSVGETTITVRTEDGRFSATVTVKVIDPQSRLYGLGAYGDTVNFDWLTFTANDPGSFQILGSGTTFAAAEYVDGKIYAYDEGGAFYELDGDTYAAERIGQSGAMVNDMTFDYMTNTMYAIVVDSKTGYTYLSAVDLSDGSLTRIGQMTEPDGNGAAVLAASPSGVLYAVGYTDGTLYTVDPATGALTAVGPTGHVPGNTFQSMTFDMTTGELYWAYVGSAEACLLYVDPQSGNAVDLGTIDGTEGLQIIGLHTRPGSVPGRPELPVTDARVLNSPLQLLQGGTASIRLALTPSNTTERDVVWTIEDTSIATVDGSIVTAVNPGATTARGKVAGRIDVECRIEVLEATGELRGYVIEDPVDMSSDIWVRFFDYDMNRGQAIYQDEGLGLTAGAYFGGKIYGYAQQSSDGLSRDYQFVVVDSANYHVTQSMQAPALDVLDMTFDYSEGVMYAIAEPPYSSDKASVSLYYVDINDGSLYEIGPVPGLVAIACDDAGTLYAINTSGNLCTLEKSTGAVLSRKDGPGYSANLYQSMTYDRKSQSLYWAQAYLSPVGNYSLALIRIDPETGAGLYVGEIGQDGCLVAALHTVSGSEPAVGAPATATRITLDKTSASLNPGQTLQLKAVVAPVSVSVRQDGIRFSSDDPAVATVSDTGLVTAVAGGVATITASYGEMSAECVVRVASDSDRLYAVSSNGWKTYSLLEPSHALSTATTSSLRLSTAFCYPADGYIYAVDTSGYLWRCTADLTTSVEKVSDTPITMQLSNQSAFGYPASVLDIEYNAYDGQTYILVSGEDPSGIGVYFLYTLDLTTGTATLVTDIPANAVDAPSAFTFISATDMIVHDMFWYDNIVRFSLDGSSQTLVSGQTVVSSFGDYVGMAYSETLNTVFIGTTYGGRGVLLALDLSTNRLTKVSETDFPSDFRDLFLVPGGQRLADAAPVSQEPAAPETAIYAFDESGWDVRGLDGVAAASANWLSDVEKKLGAVTYEPNKGLFYAVDKNTGVLLAIRPVNDAAPVVVNYNPVTGLISNFAVNGLWPTFRDIEYSAFDGKTYALISGGENDGQYHTYLYTVDLTTAAATLVCEVNPGAYTDMTAMTLISGTEAVMYESNSNGIYRVDIATGVATWLASVGSKPIALAYNSADGLVYMAGESGALCTLDPAAGEIVTVAESGYAGLTDLVLVNGSVWSGELPQEAEQPELQLAAADPNAPILDGETTSEATAAPESTVTPEPTTEPEVTEQPGSTPEPDTEPSPEVPVEPTPEATAEPVPEATAEPAPTTEPAPVPEATQPPVEEPVTDTAVMG